jgi:HEPN domain-containing protein
MPRRDELDLARVLLARAEDDDALVRKVCSDADIADPIVGFHAQQAVEKLIKAVLAARRVAFVKSHALSYLIGLVEENGISAPKELSEADVLSPWAVEFRYEGEAPPALDRPAALALIAKIKDWAESEIESVAQAAEPKPNDVVADDSEGMQTRSDDGEGGIRTRDGV